MYIFIYIFFHRFLKKKIPNLGLLKCFLCNVVLMFKSQRFEQHISPIFLKNQFQETTGRVFIFFLIHSWQVDCQRSPCKLNKDKRLEGGWEHEKQSCSHFMPPCESCPRCVAAQWKPLWPLADGPLLKVRCGGLAGSSEAPTQAGWETAAAWLQCFLLGEMEA